MLLSGKGLTLSQTNPGFYLSVEKSFENTVEKGEIGCNEQFLLFLQCFLHVWRIFASYFKLLQAISSWKSLKFVVWERVNSNTGISKENSVGPAEILP